ncbi:hypothetical protein BgiBS90_000831, partial [Biomphalaria glabrata]
LHGHSAKQTTSGCPSKLAPLADERVEKIPGLSPFASILKLTVRYKLLEPLWWSCQ